MNRDDGTTRADVVVVGAGIIGLACALRALRPGRRVLLVDRQAPGRGCSFGNAGILATESIVPLASPDTLRRAHRLLLDRHGPLAVHPRYALRILPWLLRFALAARPASYRHGCDALQRLQSRSLAAFESLLGDADGRNLLTRRGHLEIAETAAGKAALQASAARLQAAGIACRWLEPAAIRQLEPHLPVSLQGGLLYADTAHVADPYRVCRALHAAFLRGGGQELRAEVGDVQPGGADGFRVYAGNDVVDATRLVIACGAWSAALARRLGQALPLETERGYHLTVTPPPVELNRPVASAERYTFMTPMSCGLRITGFVEFGGLALPPTAARFRQLHEHLRALLPGTVIGDASEWMGCRPSLPDHLPVIGASNKHPRAIFACGHQHLGLTLSGITSEIVAALLDDRAPPIDIGAFSPERFRIMPARRGAADAARP